MTAQRATMSFAGIVIILSLILGQFAGSIDLFKPSWSWLTLFVGLNLFQSGITGFCPLTKILTAIGMK